ncbi:MAG: inorganic diphosphatase [Oscillospiraceae bacterium]|nr:inorganic diphosphatase [Oscillospiraceae bacterium]
MGCITAPDSGRNDERIIESPFADPTCNSYRDISELPAHIFSEMVHLFKVY